MGVQHAVITCEYAALLVTSTSQGARAIFVCTSYDGVCKKDVCARHMRRARALMCVSLVKAGHRDGAIGTSREKNLHDVRVTMT